MLHCHIARSTVITPMLDIPHGFAILRTTYLIMKSQAITKIFKEPGDLENL